MAKYRKKPVVIEAVQFICGSEVPAMDFLGLTDDCRKEFGHYENEVAIFRLYQPEVSSMTIKTLEGNMEVKNGDYIIRGINGEYYPCKPDIFEKTYEKVEE